MMKDEFALQKFKELYGHVFVEVKIHRGSGGGSEIIAYYCKPRMKLDWIPTQFCRRPVRCVRRGNKQPSTPTPALG